MGEIVHVTCSGCDIDRQEFLGWGMMATSATLCACDRCQRLVIKRGKWQPGEDLDEIKPLRCPYCKRILRQLFPPVDPCRDDPALGPCPRCGGTLSGLLVGIWD